jgi:hypothetical protein
MGQPLRIADPWGGRIAPPRLAKALPLYRYRPSLPAGESPTSFARPRAEALHGDRGKACQGDAPGRDVRQSVGVQGGEAQQQERPVALAGQASVAGGDQPAQLGGYGQGHR